MTPREAELERQLRLKDEENARLRTQVKLLEQKARLLEQKIDLLVRRIFGARSEQLGAAQLELLLLQQDGLGKAPASAAVADCWEAEPKRSATPKAKERAPRLPQNLPVVEQIIDPEPVKADPQELALHRAEKVQRRTTGSYEDRRGSFAAGSSGASM